MQGAGEESALPPAASSGKPHVAQRCSIVSVRGMKGLVICTDKSFAPQPVLGHVRAIPLGWLLAISPQQRSWPRQLVVAPLALLICLQPGELIACDGNVCIAGMDFAVHVPQNACEPRPAADRPCKGTLSLTATRLWPLYILSV